MAVTTFTIDGIIKPDGAPVILEYNRGMNSGSSGYRSFTGKRMIYRIMRDLKEKGGFDHIWFDNDADLADTQFFSRTVPKQYRPYTIISLLPKEALRDPSKRHLIYPPATQSHYISFCPTDYSYFPPRDIDYTEAEEIRESLQHMTGENRHVEIADYPADFDIFYRNKIHIPRLLDKGILDPAFYPRQKHYAARQSTSHLALKMYQDFKGTDRIMIKHAALCQGDGIVAVHNPTYQKVKEAIEKIKRDDPRRRAINCQNERHDIEFVVQEFVEGRPTSIRQSFQEAAGFFRSPKESYLTLRNCWNGDERQRNAAFRLFISYVNGALILHDGWLKFSDYEADAPLHDKFISGRKFAGPLSDGQKRHIFETLAPHMTRLFAHLETAGLEECGIKEPKAPDIRARKLPGLLPLRDIAETIAWTMGPDGP